MLACGIIFLRRIPALLILYKWVPEIPSWRQALFAGHFGMSAIEIDSLLVDQSSYRSSTFVKMCMV